MGKRFRGSTIAVALVSAATGAVLSLTMTSTSGQATRPARTADGKPNFSGVWQANNEAFWDLQAHEARPAHVTQPGVYPYEYARVPAAAGACAGIAAAGVPGSIGVVQGDGQIPYKPEALKTRNENADNWIDRDPELKCYLPGIPRAMYMPYPFQIVQGSNKIQMAFTFSNAARTIHLDKVEGPPDDTYMGHSVGRWEGDTLVVDVTSFNGKNWFDRAGNHHSAALHLVERFTPISPDAINYEVTVEDPNTFTRSLENRHALVSAPGAERAGHRVSVHRIFGGIHVRTSSQAAVGEAVGGRDDDRRHHPQGPAGEPLPRVVSPVIGMRPRHELIQPAGG